MANEHMKRRLTASVTGEMQIRITCDAAFPCHHDGDNKIRYKQVLARMEKLEPSQITVKM